MLTRSVLRPQEDQIFWICRKSNENEEMRNYLQAQLSEAERKGGQVTFACLDVRFIVLFHSVLVLLMSQAPLQYLISVGRFPHLVYLARVVTVSVVAHLAVKSMSGVIWIVRIIFFLAWAAITLPSSILTTLPHLDQGAFLCGEFERDMLLCEVSEVLVDVHERLTRLLHLLKRTSLALSPPTNLAWSVRTTKESLLPDKYIASDVLNLDR